MLRNGSGNRGTKKLIDPIFPGPCIAFGACKQSGTFEVILGYFIRKWSYYKKDAEAYQNFLFYNRFFVFQ